MTLPYPHPASEVTTKVMKANKSKDTKPEMILRKALREAGFPGYRLHWKKAPGHPDIAYPGRKVAIFVNGCFWHSVLIVTFQRQKGIRNTGFQNLRGT